MKTSARNLVTNIVANQSGFLVSAVVTFFLSPFVVNSLGGSRYGMWTLIVSLTGNYGLLAFGIQGAMTRYMAYAAATGDREQVNGYFNTAWLFLLFSAAFACIVGAVIALCVENLFVVPPPLVKEAKLACLLVTASAAVTFIFTPFDSLMVAHQRFKVTNAIGITCTLIRSVMTVWLLKNGYSIIALAGLTAALTATNGLAAAMASMRLFPDLRLSLSLGRVSYLKDLASYAYKSFTVMVGSALIYQFDLMVIAGHLPPDKVTSYSLASTLITYLIQFVSAIAYTIGPFVTALHASGQREELRVFFLQASSLMYMLGGLLAGGATLFGSAFFTLWVGPQYAGSAAILTILVLPHFFATGARVATSMLSGMAIVGPLAVAMLTEGVTNVLLSVILVKHFGITGVAFGTFIPLLVSSGLWTPYYICRVISVPVRTLIASAMLPAALQTMVLGAAWMMLLNFVPATNWRELVALVGAFCVTGSGMTYWTYGRVHRRSPLVGLRPVKVSE